MAHYDVQWKAKCSEEKAQEILESAAGNDWITEQINVTIDDIIDDEKLERTTEEEQEKLVR